MALATIDRNSKWKWIAFGLAALLIGFFVWNGADRRASDASVPLRKSEEHQAFLPPPRTLKLASFNIHSGKGRDGVQDLSRIAELLADMDFAGLYEVRATSFSPHPNQAATLGRLRNAAWLFAPSENQWWLDHFGNGLLYRIPVNSMVRIPLVNTRGKAFRNAILSRVKLQENDIRILAVHIDRGVDRCQQLQTVIDLFNNLERPCVLIGDLNTTSEDPLLQSLLNQPGVLSPLHETMKSGPPRDNIDWIFTRGLKTITAELVENIASDHPLLKVELAPTDVVLVNSTP